MNSEYRQNVIAFLNSHVNQGVDVDHNFGPQCWDLSEDFNEKIVHGPYFYGNAIDIWNQAGTHYDRIPNTPEFVPQLGDIFVFGSSYGGGYGHTGICTGEGDVNQFRSLDQNWVNGGANGSKASYVWHSYSGLLGVLRPKIAATVALAPNEGMSVGDGLRVHTEPNTTSGVNRTLNEGERVVFDVFTHGETVNGTWGNTDIWYHIPEGWVSDGYLKTATNIPTVPLYQPLQTNQAKMSADTPLNVRNKPTTIGSNIVGKLDPGQVVKVESRIIGQPIDGDSEWYKISGYNGYASGKFFEVPSGFGVPSEDNPDPVETPVPSAPAGGLKVIDVSSFQGDIDWAKVKADGITAVIMEAGHVGKSFGGDDNNADPKVNVYAQGAAAQGFDIGYYWYAFLSLDPIDEANKFLKVIAGKQTGSLWLDLEDATNADADKKAWATKFMARVEEQAGRLCHLYTGYNYAKNNDLSGLLVKGRKLWIANYNGAPGQGVSDTGLGDPVMHQYTDKAKVNGIAGDVDMSVFLGDLTAFRTLAGELPTPVPPGSQTDPVEPTPPVVTPPAPQDDSYNGFLANVRRLLSELWEAIKAKLNGR